MAKKILLLGATGKIGTALSAELAQTHEVIGKSRKDIDVADFALLRALYKEVRPDIVANAIAYVGVDACEQQPEAAFRINSLYPRLLAELANESGALLVHFSSDAVFDDSKGAPYTETDGPRPLNVYGLTKYGGDCLVQALARRYYLFRIPVLFGENPKNNQFVEKMLQRVTAGEKQLRVSDDIISSPTYSRDVAREVHRFLDAGLPAGLYHLANEGQASLCDLMKEIVSQLRLDVQVVGVPGSTFPSRAVKNTRTPLRSVKTTALRPWRDAVQEYCSRIRGTER